MRPGYKPVTDAGRKCRNEPDQLEDRMFVISRGMATVCLGLACAGFSPADQAAVERGRTLAETACSSCHLVERNHATDAAPAFATIARDPARSDDWVRVWLTAPHPPMRGLDLTVREIDDIIAYLHSLDP
jgi:cytochrome c